MRRHVTTIVAVAGLAIGPAAIATADPVSPDARDANAAAQSTVQRSPDARDLNLAAQQQSHSLSVADPRSPDARDAEDVLVIPAGVIPHSVPVSVASPRDGGFGWDDAGIGAAGLLVLALLTTGAVAGVQHHRRRAPSAPLVG